MRYRLLGSTQLKVSVIGFGASPLGNVFGDADPEESKRAVRFAIDEGINFFDVSPYYGLTLAEEQLGLALQGCRDRVVLSTKCGRYGSGEFDFSARRVLSSVDESLRRLRTDHVDLLQAHDVEFGDLRQIIEETIPAMRQLQKEGKVRYIGISGYPPRALMRVAGSAPVDTILSYCRYNLLANDLEAELATFAETHGIGLINASPLHMGVLTDQGAPDWHPASPEVYRAAKQAAEFCQLHQANLSEIALRFCFDYPRVATTLVGLATREQVRRSLRALEAPANPELVEQVQSIFAPVFNQFWTSGREENQ